VCNGNALTGIFGVTIQADSQDRETAMIGDINVQGREGLFMYVSAHRFDQRARKLQT
jgi:hypothetical protein